jgi:hypothetical protein
MRQGIVRSLLVILVLCLGAMACEDDPAVEERRLYGVSYSLNISGESTVSQVTFYGSGQDNTINNPPDGWSVQITVGDGNVVSASASGTAKNGAIILTMRVIPVSGDQIVKQDECSESEGTPTACALATEGVSLK